MKNHMEENHTLPLKECLNMYKKDTLAGLIDMNGFEIKKSLKKAEIVEALEKAILSNFDTIMENITLEAYSGIKHLISQNMQMATAESKQALTAYAQMGIMAIFKDDEGVELHVIPGEIITKFTERCDSKLQEQICKREVVNRVIKGLVNLYGVLTQDHLMLVLEKMKQPVMLDEKLAGDCLRLSTAYKLHYKAVGGVVMHEELLEQEVYKYIIHSSSKSFYYMPTFDEILKYAENEYDTENPYYTAVREFLEKKSGLEKKKTDEIMAELSELCVIDATPVELMDCVGEAGVMFKNDRQANEFTGLLMDMNNNTRKWVLKGNKSIDVLPKEDIITSEDFREMPKLGRNDPCPCGSGKKYKNCCGSN